MDYDVFFSISQTPVDGVTPTEAEMLRAFLEEVEAADRLGYGCAWVAESHLSTQVQKQHARPVVPHWKGEIGLNTDIFQLAHKVFGRTSRIEVGAAIMNLVCNGGPVARAEQLAAFAALHGADPDESRRLRIGFSAGRFDFMNRAYGIGPRDAVEAEAWPALKGKVFAEACEIFLRLVRGEAISSDDIRETVLTRDNFRTDEHWERVQAAAAADGRPTDVIPIPRRWVFDILKIVPQDFRRDVFDLTIGSHDPELQVDVNQYLPVKVFNLSITRPEVIDATHARLTEAYHPDGGSWERSYMPRTVMVFLNADPGLDAAAQSAAAHADARKALGAYWTALEGTLDPSKVERAADNAVIGNVDEVASQLAERFHPDDRLMLWFDFFQHDPQRVIDDMAAFKVHVAPRVAALQEEARA
ncbi:MAG: LLM class flavin-dependent oxidoreductase [Myxococcota bacterium]|nr:LLM class flavin-dependent oxidoreductase [Myxococcota bacterium]MEC8422164.1 LLM class flavin-dependent oxidoreductase [Myxococcota bacterium]